MILIPTPTPTPTPTVMGVINLSAHSFYQALPHYSDALKKAEQMVCDGAGIIDVGAIATNPFVNLETDTPSLQQELDLVIPFIELLSKKINITISVDTYRADVMREAIASGAHMINDQHALTEENALKTAVKLAVPVCLMHYFHVPRKQDNTLPVNGLTQIIHELQNHISRCLSAGIKKENIIIDPGFGGGHFGKTADENFYLLANLKEIIDLGFPVLVGLSRKIMFAEIQTKIEDRLYASIAAAVIAALQGASIIRVHDVKETVDAMRVVARIKEKEIA
ncbi:MAG: dihydropteroate synthase [Gammaproteobacteria bacterium RIFCSPHIGHO2_02_FULL_39_13]|nr:MAG: dihydropteroate synthase [Gammaproteobacteria bacterium RIFCSPHIGHO2_02_FULL_39_13]OGT49605.1 MAG: dihydropteroate synthase [Gammaproteobacteria bacterium RIFCSPHIGHO2_12_FULL_39_24]